jgi:hypothetical protein
VARRAGSAADLLSLEVTCWAWRHCIRMDDGVWRALALSRFPRLKTLQSFGELSSFRSAYENHSTLHTIKCPRDWCKLDSPQRLALTIELTWHGELRASWTGPMSLRLDGGCLHIEGTALDAAELWQQKPSWMAAIEEEFFQRLNEKPRHEWDNEPIRLWSEWWHSVHTQVGMDQLHLNVIATRLETMRSSTLFRGRHCDFDPSVRDGESCFHAELRQGVGFDLEIDDANVYSDGSVRLVFRRPFMPALEMGSRARIIGLQSKPQLNGELCVARRCSRSSESQRQRSQSPRRRHAGMPLPGAPPNLFSIR